MDSQQYHATLAETENIVQDNFHHVNYRIVQIHPSLRCNLSCLHCYSASLPSYTQALPVNKLIAFLAEAREEGFNTVSLSGGEPFSYRELPTLYAETKNMGYKNLVATNAMLLKSKKAQETLRHIDLAAVSIDGPPEKHNYIRNHPNAFNEMLQGVEILKQHLPAFGFIHTVTPSGLNDLIWLTEFAIDKEASLLQLHPLEAAGRATDQMAGEIMAEEHRHTAFIIANLLKVKCADVIQIQLDLLHKDYIIRYPETAYYKPAFRASNETLIGDLFKSVVVDENGNILPIGYGLNHRFNIGNIFEPLSFSEMRVRFMERTWYKLCHLFEYTYKQILTGNSEIIMWSQLFTENSHTADIV